MKLRSYGKINIFLNILGKRENGYHDIETLIQRVDLFDEIDLTVDKSFKGIDIVIKCDNDEIPTDNRNLCYKACEWFMRKYNLEGKIIIDIHKNIPIFAGLGGGTSNGAEIIKALNNIYGLDIDLSILSRDSVALGADFPYSIIGGTVLCEGIGENVKVVNSFDGNIILIIKPKFGFSTKDIYENFNLEYTKKNISKSDLLNNLSQGNFIGVCNNISNTLEYSDIKEMDIIRDIKSKLILKGAINSCMSGSGSSVYGIFDNLYLAQKCYDDFKIEFDEVFLTKTINK